MRSLRCFALCQFLAICLSVLSAAEDTRWIPLPYALVQENATLELCSEGIRFRDLLFVDLRPETTPVSEGHQSVAFFVFHPLAVQMDTDRFLIVVPSTRSEISVTSGEICDLRFIGESGETSDSKEAVMPVVAVRVGVGFRGDVPASLGVLIAAMAQFESSEKVESVQWSPLDESAIVYLRKRTSRMWISCESDPTFSFWSGGTVVPEEPSGAVKLESAGPYLIKFASRPEKGIKPEWR